MPSITYLNKPRLSEHEVDNIYNERRLALVSKLDEFISSHSLFKDKDVIVLFAQNGVSSLVSILETKDEKIVLKIPLSIQGSENEGIFLKAWERVGVAVPHVIEEGSIGDYHYILMKYIDAPNLRDFYGLGSLVKEKVFVQMGSVLRQMHATKAEGYGRLNNGKPEYSKFNDWLTSDSKRKIAYVKEHNLLNDESHGSLEESFQIFVDFVTADKRSTYCHNDFAIENVFATTPITVFDPAPTFNHPFVDLARAIVIGISRCGSEVAEQFIMGYFKDDNYNKEVVRAATLLGAYLKFPYWHKTNQTKRIQYLQDYLSKHRPALVS